MAKDNFEESIVQELKAKLKSPDNDFNICNMIYRFHRYKQNIYYQTDGLVVVGVGELVDSNNMLYEGKINTLKDIEGNYNILILKSLCDFKHICLLVPPTAGLESDYEDFFNTGFACFDIIERGVKDKTNWLISNDLNDEVEIYPVAFKKEYPLEDFLNESAIKMGKLTIGSLFNRTNETFQDLYNKLIRSMYD